jgi:hypothetical protein
MEFYFDDDTVKACTYYSGECTKTTAAAKDSIWERVPCCYWTFPTLITADSLCSNSAEATMNNKADAAWNTGYEFTKLQGNLDDDFTKESCQRLCVDFEENC